MNLPDNINFLKKNFELLAWATGLLALGAMNPSTDPHFSCCLFKLMGFQSCPGCGLGHAVSFLLHGKIDQSVRANPMVLFALPVLSHRIVKLSLPLFFKRNKQILQ